FHGSFLPDGSYGGQPVGVLLTVEEKTIYHAGDTALFSDMRLIGKAGVDLALLPVGDNFTMGPEDALTAADFLDPKMVIPMHFGTWPIIDIDPQRFFGPASQRKWKTFAPVVGEIFQLN
ncbi:MBL fold metallo-hydrolase, partial [Myxococcota bacterium]|nr:MBL fold metallo-hydrolase [Myxococcota bacterium]MBU1534147.1 MBL fold metallo-hydrolase [Myxococcota bacterium]